MGAWVGPTAISSSEVPNEHIMPSSDLTTVIFASGCFWLRQHSFVAFEQSTLGRAADEITTVAGYAGGIASGIHGEVCHYNAAHTSEYSTLGYAEAVRVSVPTDQVAAAAAIYFQQSFAEIASGVWAREDVYDQGPAYRAIIALPGGGILSPLMPQVRRANVHNMTLIGGSIANATADTFGTSSVWILDADDLPFHQSELCLQFHDPQGGAFPPDYHALKQTLIDVGRLAPVKNCPVPLDCGSGGLTSRALYI